MELLSNISNFQMFSTLYKNRNVENTSANKTINDAIKAVITGSASQVTGASAEEIEDQNLKNVVNRLKRSNIASARKEELLKQIFSMAQATMSQIQAERPTLDSDTSKKVMELITVNEQINPSFSNSVPGYWQDARSFNSKVDQMVSDSDTIAKRNQMLMMSSNTIEAKEAIKATIEASYTKTETESAIDEKA
jgi:hypothetical protein